MVSSDVKKFFLRWRKELVGLAVLVGLASVVLLLLWQLGQVTFVKGKVTPVQIITALFVLMGLYWTSRRVLAAEDNVRVAEEGHITERFTRAIAQLGDDKMAIRLGGVYALERIAKDSEKDHSPIMEILTAYVREKAPVPEEEIDTPEEYQRPPTDIQAILTVIGRRETTGNDTPLNLTRTRLVGAILSRPNLSGAILSWAKLSRAILLNADLSDADLVRANLSGADLVRAYLSRATLSRANLKFADLSDADLVGANLNDATLSGATLVRANLNDADLVRANLSGAYLSKAYLKFADLSDADLVRANLSDATLSGADLVRANLSRANLEGATNLTAEQVRSTENWRDATLPDYLNYLKDTPEPAA